MELSRLITSTSCPAFFAYYIKQFNELKSVVNENIARVREENDLLTRLHDIHLQDVKIQNYRLFKNLFLRHITCS